MRYWIWNRNQMHTILILLLFFTLFISLFIINFSSRSVPSKKEITKFHLRPFFEFIVNFTFLMRRALTLLFSCIYGPIHWLKLFEHSNPNWKCYFAIRLKNCVGLLGLPVWRCNRSVCSWEWWLGKWVLENFCCPNALLYVLERLKISIKF